MDIGKVEKYQRQWRESVQGKVSEPVLAVGIFNRRGSWGAVGLGYLSGAASLLQWGRTKRRAPGLPDKFLLAVTSTKVHAFGFRPAGTNIKVKDEHAVWDRSTLRVTEGEGKVTDRLVLEPEGGSGDEERGRVEVESSKWGGDVNEPVVRLLQDPTLQDAGLAA